MVDDMRWWAVPIVSLVIFTLYGIEGIGCQLEDPFGYDRNDIKMDAIVGDAKIEVGAVLSEWRKLMASVQAANHPSVGQNGVTEERKASFAPPDMFLRAAPRVSR